MLDTCLPFVPFVRDAGFPLVCVDECGCCQSALYVLQCSAYLRGASLAQQSHSKGLKKECADVLESLKVRVSQHFML